MATAKKAPANQALATKAPAKKSTAPVKAASSKRAAPAKAVTPAKKAPAPAKKAPAPAKKAPTPTKAAGPSKPAGSSKAAASSKNGVPVVKKGAPAPVKQPAVAKKSAADASGKKVTAAPTNTFAAPAAPVKKAPSKKAAAAPVVIEIAAVKGVTKDGVAYTKDFDVKFLTAQKTLLLEERAALLGQATRLEDEANSLIEEQEMGDVQFDDEGGEGDTMVVERERDLTLSAQARQTIADIESALERLRTGRYGYSVESGRPIPRERLEAIPWATMLVEEKVGGIGRR